MKIDEGVKNILFDLSPESAINDESLLRDDLLLDSLAMVTLLVQIEDLYEIELDESDMNPFDLTTVKNVVELVEKYCGGINE